MEKILESKFIKWAQDASLKLSQNDVVSAIMSATMSVLTLIMVGSFFSICVNLPATLGILNPDGALYAAATNIYNYSMGLLGVFLSVSMGYFYGKNKGGKPLSCALTSLAVFMLVAAPQVCIDEENFVFVMQIDNLGGSGTTIALLTSVSVVLIDRFCEKFHLEIKLPESVPPFVSDSFTAMIPCALALGIWQAIALLCDSMFGMTAASAILSIMNPFMNLVNSVPGVFVIAILTCVFWTFGIHGSMVFMFTYFVYLEALEKNAMLVAQGQAPVFSPIYLTLAIAIAGGDGNPLPLVLLGLKGKSEQVRSVSKACLIPSIFNISEPVIFGFPLMYNILLGIPMVLSTVITTAIIWLGYEVGFFVPDFISAPPGLPVFITSYYGALAWQNCLMPVIAIVVGLIVFYPFFKSYDNNLFLQEQESKEGK